MYGVEEGTFSLALGLLLDSVSKTFNITMPNPFHPGFGQLVEIGTPISSESLPVQSGVKIL